MRRPPASNVARRTAMRPVAVTDAGFTLIELMVTVAVFGILISMAIPNFSDLVNAQRVKAVAGDLYATLAFARSEAIKRNDYIGICAKTDDGSGCQNSTDWARGWIVFIDTDGDGYPGAVSDILKRQDTIPKVTLTGPAGNISYQRDGRLRASVTAFAASSPSGSHIPARSVSLDLSGRPNIK
jgi:type IV fimbrial biogenesis protein FimT